MSDYSKCNVSELMVDLSPKSRDLYILWIKRFTAYVHHADILSIDIHVMDLNELALYLNYAKVVEWLGSVKTEMPSRGKSSFQSARNAVNWLARLLVSCNLLDPSLPVLLSTLPLPRSENGQHPGTWLTQDGLNTLIAAIQSAPQWRPDRRSRNLLIVGFMALVGLRCSEVASINWADVFTDHGLTLLRVHGKGSKLRTVKLPESLVDWIEEWREFSPQHAPDDAMFIDLWIQSKRGSHRPIESSALLAIVGKASVLAGLPHLSPHDLRRTFSRLAYESGAPYELVRQTLGHAHIQMTEHYVNSKLQLDRTATDVLAEWLEKDDD